MEVYDMKKKMYLSAMIAVFSMAVSTVPAWASDAPTDDGNYIWQDENGDYWYRNGSEDEYIGEGNYAPDPDTGELILGDFIISVDRVRDQAESYGHSRKREFAFLVAHSMLHLCGYDHMEPEEAEVMEAKQEQVLASLGITRD